MAAHQWNKVAATATHQAGRLAACQLAAAGMSRANLKRDVIARGGSWPQRGVAAVLGAPKGAEGDAWAAVLAAGRDARLTGCAGLAARGLAVPAGIPIAVLIPHKRKVRPLEGVRIVRTRQLLPDPPHDALPVAAIARCLADAAVEVGPRALRKLIAAARRRRMVSLDDLVAEVATRRRFPGRQVLRQVIARMRGETTDSDAEEELRAALRRRGLRPHPAPMTLYLDGRPISEPDIPFPQLTYGIQVDGPHHDEPQQAASDRVQDRLADQIGWHIERFSVDEIDDDVEAVADQIAQTVARRRARLQEDAG